MTWTCCGTERLGALFSGTPNGCVRLNGWASSQNTIRAPSTLGSHLRTDTWGNVAQLEKAGREFLAEPARQAPRLPGAETLAFIDIDSMQNRVYGLDTWPSGHLNAQ
jgi:hypothetical protein